MSKKLLLLTAEKDNWAPKELVKAAEAAGFTVEIINPDECYISLTNEPYISAKGTKFLGADLCLARMSEEHLDYKCAILNHIQEMEVKLLNTADALKIASSKIETQIKLNAIGLKTPKTALFTNEEQLEFAMESIGDKFPMILKTISGTHGIGVVKADSKASAVSIAQQLLKTGCEFMLQEFIEHKESARILLLGDKVLASVMRTVPPAGFRSNAHLGAELKKYEPSEKEITAVKKAAKEIGIAFSAVDYIMHEDEVIILEVNGSPGFESMQKVVDINIAEEVIKYCEALIEGNGDLDYEHTPEPIDVNVSGDNDKVEIQVQKGPAEEEEEEEEVDSDKDSKKVVDVDKEKKDDDEKEIHPHHNVVNPELLDQSHEHIIGTVTSVKIAHFNDDAAIESRVDTGANTSSIAGEDIKIDKHANKVSFKFNGVTYKFHLLRIAKVKQADSDKAAERPIIRVDMEINGIKLRNIELNINTRPDMLYPILLGRSTLAQAGLLVNPAVNNIDLQNVQISTEQEEE